MHVSRYLHRARRRLNAALLTGCLSAAACTSDATTTASGKQGEEDETAALALIKALQNNTAAPSSTSDLQSLGELLGVHLRSIPATSMWTVYWEPETSIEDPANWQTWSPITAVNTWAGVVATAIQTLAFERPPAAEQRDASTAPVLGLSGYFVGLTQAWKAQTESHSPDAPIVTWWPELAMRWNAELRALAELQADHILALQEAFDGFLEATSTGTSEHDLLREQVTAWLWWVDLAAYLIAAESLGDENAYRQDDHAVVMAFLRAQLASISAAQAEQPPGEAINLIGFWGLAVAQWKNAGIGALSPDTLPE